MLSKATELKASYDEYMRRLMAKHGIQTEFEAWSVFVLLHNHESRDYKFAEEFGERLHSLPSDVGEWSHPSDKHFQDCLEPLTLMAVRDQIGGILANVFKDE